MPQSYVEEAQSVDTVLDVKQIARWSYQLGPEVTVSRIPGAMHDVYLSRKEVREDAFARTERWLTYALGV